MSDLLICRNPNCLHENLPDSIFCEECGRLLSIPEQPEPSKNGVPGITMSEKHINVVDASDGGVVAIGFGAKAIKNTGTFIESMVVGSNGKLDTAQAARRKCPKCEEFVDAGDHFCHFCGEKF